MKRLAKRPRIDWQKKVEQAGLFFHHGPEGLYWDESAYYRFSAREVDEIELATNNLHELCLAAVQHIIDEDLFSQLQIPQKAVALIKETWEDEPPSIYGRFDLAYDGKSPPKLLEYNADTPTSLLETSVVQWFWLEDEFKSADQFNSIHEKLLAKWSELRSYMKGSPLYFTYASGSIEDMITVRYMEDLAVQAGIAISEIIVDDIGWNHDARCFCDLSGKPVTSIFKLYPWEWLLSEQFGDYLIESHSRMQWIEPAWKMVLSNKGILPILWELNPGHPNLLEAHFNRPQTMAEYVQKPFFSREGANVVIKRRGGKGFKTGGTYGAEGFIYQQPALLPIFDGNYPVIGSWVIDGESAGIGIRESRTPITDNYSRFVPHMFE